MPSHADMKRDAEEGGAPPGFHKDSSGYDVPDDGWVGTVFVAEARAKATAAGYPGYNLWLEVIGQDQPAEGSRFWDGTFFSANQRANGISYAKLEALGIPESFWDTNPSDEQVCAALSGLKCKAKVTYDPNKNDPDSPWLRCTFIPIEGANSDIVKLDDDEKIPAATPAAEAIGDDEVDETQTF